MVRAQQLTQDWVSTRPAEFSRAFLAPPSSEKPTDKAHHQRRGLVRGNPASWLDLKQVRGVGTAAEIAEEHLILEQKATRAIRLSHPGIVAHR